MGKTGCSQVVGLPCGTIRLPCVPQKSMKFALSLIALVLLALIVPFFLPGAGPTCTRARWKAGVQKRPEKRAP